jgi:hypothetical protein
MRLDLKQIISYAEILLMASFFLKENLNSLAIILFSLLILVQCIVIKGYIAFKKAIVIGLPLILYYLLSLIGIFVNQDSNNDYLVRLLPFLVSPIFIYYHVSSGSKKTAINFFLLANVLFLIFLDILAIKDMIIANSLFIVEEGGKNYRFLYTRFTGNYFNHIYLSTYSLFSIALLFQFKIVKTNFLRNLLAAYLLLHIALLGSRAVVIGILIASLFSFIALSILDKKNLKYLLGLLVAFLIASSVIYSYRNTLLMNRYAQAFEWWENKELILKRDYSINNRAKLYVIGFSMFEDLDRYDINGTGLAPNEIKRKYSSEFKDEFILKTITYNAHNQFINNFIDWGILGILLLCYLLFMTVKVSFANKLNWIAFFWLSFCIILMMESFLIRHRGIVFFVFFYTLFGYYKPQLRDDKLR